MKILVLDRLILMIIGMVVTIFYFSICKTISIATIMMTIINVFWTFSWAYFCREILLLPLDLLCGKVTKEAYYVRQATGHYEFLKKRYYAEWRFWWHKGGVFLIVPMDATMEEIEKLETPPQNKKLLITYYRFSKIFIDYKIM